VLIVEDDPDLREMMCLLLAHEGFEVEAARDGVEALERLRSAAPRPQLILLDLMMPRMDGWEFCRKLAGEPGLEKIPVVVLSAASEHRHVPATAVLPKPVDFDDLLAVIRRISDDAASGVR